MDLENDKISKPKDHSDNVNIKELQANLFPLLPKMSGFFSNYFLRSQLDYDENEENQQQLVRSSGSKDLLAINRESNFQLQPARWPTECQVLPEAIAHSVIANFPQPEAYYVPTGLEMQPKPSGEEYGMIVYQYNPISAVNYFSRSSVGGSRYLLSTNICPEENSLKFESRFESGNLEKAIRLTSNYYELYLRSDLYTNRYMQWFYFRVTNMRKNFLYRFSIVNFTKDGSLYNSGLRPLMYSEKDMRLNQVGWKRCGDQITYFSNDNTTENGEDQQMTYTLTFTVIFPHEEDTVYFASCYPYTYTNLQNYLWDLSKHPVKSTYTTIRLLCKSLAGNNVDYVTITSPQEEDEIKKKRAIVITGRVHPGETPSSWMMKGIIDFLTSDTPPARELRDKFIFKIVPMLNPDGVVVGNNRCSLTGKDLNRQYRTVMRESYPSIWYTKLMVRRLIEECGVSMYCDLHGHSRKHNIFIYGCENRKQNEKRLQEQIFPLMLHKNASERFSFEDCSFRVQKGKEGTGRIVMWMMGITNSYTLEASFAGSTLGSRSGTHFSIQDYEQMGKSFCQTLLDYYDEDPRKEKLRVKILNRLDEGGSCAGEPANIRLSDYSSDDGSSSDFEENGAVAYRVVTVPPPSPSDIFLNECQNNALKKTQKQRKFKNFTKNSSAVTRKVAPVRKTNLTLSLGYKVKYSGTSSDSESETRKIVGGGMKKNAVKSSSAKKKNQQQQQQLHHHQNEENEVVCSKKSVGTQAHSVLALDFEPPEDYIVNLRQKSKLPQLRWFNAYEKRNGLDVDDRLTMVQQKLMVLKNKIWHGSGDGDQPLSWGSLMVNNNNNNEVENGKTSSSATNDKNGTLLKKVKKKFQRKGTAAKGKPKTEGRRKVATKKSANLKRQNAIESKAPVIINHVANSVKKSRSFDTISTGSSKRVPKFKNYASCDDKESKAITIILPMTTQTTAPTGNTTKKRNFKASNRKVHNKPSKRSFA